MLDRNSLAATLTIAPLFALFALFIVTLWLRSRHNTNPQNAQTARGSGRSAIITWLITVAVAGVAAYATLERDRFQPSWLFTAFAVYAAFLLGEAVGRWAAERKFETQSTLPLDQQD